MDDTTTINLRKLKAKQLAVGYLLAATLKNPLLVSQIITPIMSRVFKSHSEILHVLLCKNSLPMISSLHGDVEEFSPEKLRVRLTFRGPQESRFQLLLDMRILPGNPQLQVVNALLS